MKVFRTAGRRSTVRRDSEGSETQARNRGLSRGLWLLTALIAAALFAFLPAAATGAGNPSANLDQCANGQAPSPHSDGCNLDSTDWVNGNLGGSKANYFEGDSIPYRMLFDNLSLGSHTVTIQWDTTKSDKHAIDYLTSFNQSVLNANPCLGVTGCNFATGAPFAIPADPQVVGGGVTPIAGNFMLYGGNITAVSAYSYPGGTGFTGDKTAQLTLTFTASSVNPVLAWGGHIASRADWGLTNSAVSIPGSPYHTRLIDLDGAGGNQDRSLSEDAVTFPGFIHIIKHTTGGNDTFGYTASPAPLSDFNITTSGGTGEQDFNNITNFTTYTVNESTLPSHWAFDSLNCSVDSANGGSRTVTNASVAINLKEGEEVTCTYANHHTVNSPALSTNAGADVELGATGNNLSDSATLSGATSDASGTITYHLYRGADCSRSEEHTGSPVTNTTVAGNGIYVSPTIHVSLAGTYRWVANYGGDANNSATPNGCNGTNENVVVGPRSPALSTDAGGPFRLSADEIPSVDLTDQATLSGGTNDATGTISFTLFGPDSTPNSTEGDCTEANQVGTASADVTKGANDATYTSSAVTVTEPGTYHWVASYSGDTNNNGSESTCGDQGENPVVIAPHISVVKSATDATDEQVIRNGGTATWTIQVINDGSSTLTDVNVTDELAPGCARTSEDIEGLASMPPAPAEGSSVTYTCTLANVTASFTNVAVATGTPDVGEDVSAQDTSHVTVINPAISISKPPHTQTVAFAGPATFTIGSKNTGDSTLTNVIVTDALAPGCAQIGR